MENTVSVKHWLSTNKEVMSCIPDETDLFVSYFLKIDGINSNKYDMYLRRKGRTRAGELRLLSTSSVLNRLSTFHTVDHIALIRGE